MEQIGRYTILRRLGGGGFGEVWLGRDDIIDRDVAVKVFNPKDENLIAFATSSNAEGLEALRNRFTTEARILASMESNPFVVNVLDFGETQDGAPYYVMPYLPHSLTDLLGRDIYDEAAIRELKESDRPRSLPLDDALRILEQLLQGLAAAHAKELVHRDIKPANIMLTDEGEVRLVDFGIAKAPDGQHSTVSQLGMGSRNYMAPEQRESAKHVDARADVYAVGCVAYRMITGRLPTGRFSDPNVYAPALSQSINDLIISCLSENKDQRPAAAGSMLDSLRAGLSEQGPSGDETGTWVEGQESIIRDELKPLRDEISRILDSNVEIDETDFKRLEAMAAVVELDSDGLKTLISSIEAEKGKALQHKRNFLQLLDSSVSAQAEPDTEMLYKAAAPTGWDSDEIDTLIRKRRALHGVDNQPEEKSSGSAGSVIVTLIFVVILAGAGYFGWAEWQKRQALAQADQSAWQSAASVDTVAGFEGYLSQHPDGEYVGRARDAINRLREAESAAAELAESLTSQAQRLLSELGYRVPTDGNLDLRTQKAIETFEAELNLPVTGNADQLLVDALEQELARRNELARREAEQQDEAAWREARRADTEAAYTSYRNEYPQGKYASEVAGAIRRANDARAWQAARSGGSIASYEAYLSEFPNGEQTAAARTAIQQIKNQQAAAAAERERLAAEQAAREKLVSDVQTELQRLELLARNQYTPGVEGTASTNAIRMFESIRELPLSGTYTADLLEKLKAANLEDLNRIAATIARYFSDSGRVWMQPYGDERLRMGETLFTQDNRGNLKELRITGRSGSNYVAYTDANLNLPAGTTVARNRNAKFSVMKTEVADTQEVQKQIPIVKVAPVYPRRAASRGIEGYCVVEFTVTAVGTTKDIVAKDCNPIGLFDSASINAAAKFKFKPRLVNGIAVETTGVTNRFDFELAN